MGMPAGPSGRKLGPIIRLEREPYLRCCCLPEEAEKGAVNDISDARHNIR
jgi:hypothetical protein